jgi:four helix bundle protein
MGKKESGNMGIESGNIGNTGSGKKFRSFLDLDVYKRTFEASNTIIFRIIPKLPKNERFDLADQMRRASKAIPTLIAEGYAKKYQQKGFQRYLQEAMSEANEMIVHLSFAKEYLKTSLDELDLLIESYVIAGKQLYKLQENWRNLTKRIVFP